MSSTPIEKMIKPEKYRGLNRDFAEFCLEELERKRFSAESFDEDVFLQAVRLVLDKLVPSETEADYDH